MTPSAWATLVLAVSNVLAGVLIGWNLHEARQYRRMNARLEKELELEQKRQILELEQERQIEECLRDWVQRRGK